MPRGPSAEKKGTIDYLWRELQQSQFAFWNTIQIGAYGAQWQTGLDTPIVFHSQKNHEMVQKRRPICLLHVALYHGNRQVIKRTFSTKFCGTKHFFRAVKCFSS